MRVRGAGCGCGPDRRALLRLRAKIPLSPGTRVRKPCPGVSCGAWTAVFGARVAPPRLDWFPRAAHLLGKCLYSLIVGSGPHMGSEYWPQQPTGEGRWTQFCKDTRAKMRYKSKQEKTELLNIAAPFFFDPANLTSTGSTSDSRPAGTFFFAALLNKSNYSENYLFYKYRSLSLCCKRIYTHNWFLCIMLTIAQLLLGLWAHVPVVSASFSTFNVKCIIGSLLPPVDQ